MTDARLIELAFLARLERDRVIDFSHRGPSDPEVRIAIDLLAKGIVNDATTVAWDYSASPMPVRTENWYRAKVESEQWTAIARLHGGQQVRINSTPAASARRAELEQSIQRGRLRDPSGILIDGRHAESDLFISIVSASKDEPMCLGFLDMNGLKLINDTHGHAAGDEAIRSFFEVIAACVSEGGEAHRVGGDEVIITLRNTRLSGGAAVAQSILRALSGRTVAGVALSAAVGLAECSDPSELPASLRERADQAQYLAKEVSRARFPVRTSVLCVHGGAPEEVVGA